MNFKLPEPAGDKIWHEQPIPAPIQESPPLAPILAEQPPPPQPEAAPLPAPAAAERANGKRPSLRKRLIFAGLLLIAIITIATRQHHASPAAAEQRLQAQPKEPGAREDPNRLAIPADSHLIALLDLQTLSEFDWPFIRYVWIQEPTPERVKAVTLALNYISRATIAARPVPLGKGGLIRVDLRRFAPRVNDIKEWINAWDELRFDPTFHLLITKDVLNFLLKNPDLVLPPARVWGDEGFEEVPLRSLDVKNVDVVRLNGPHLNLAAVANLQDLCQTAAPVVEYRYFLQRTLTAVQDAGPFKTIWGGLYYDFIGIKQQKDKKDAKTDQDLLLEQLGINNEKVFDDLRSDRRVAMFRSDITGRPRRVDILPTLASGDGASIVSITHDFREQDIDIGQHPILNLLKVKDTAREIIFRRNNGTNGFALTNGEGALQREAPIDVVSDRTIPNPHPPRLQPALSCISCHDASGDDGWKPLKNDVALLVAAKLDIFGDITNGDDTIPDTVDRLAGLYTRSLNKVLQRARDDFAEATLRITGPWKAAKDDQSDVLKTAATEIVQTVYRYRYDLVDPQQALREIGIESTKEEAITKLKAVLPPGNALLGIIPEDARIGALKAGVPINRVDWSLIYAAVATRAQLNPLPAKPAKPKEDLPIEPKAALPDKPADALANIEVVRPIVDRPQPAKPLPEILTVAPREFIHPPKALPTMEPKPDQHED